MEEDEVVNAPDDAFLDVAASVGADAALRDDAWKSYEAVKQQCTLEGSQEPWYVCALYLSSWQASFPTGPEIKRLSLSRLAEVARLGILELFEKLGKWAEMSTNSRRVQDHVARVQSTFAVSAVIFKKFLPVFRAVFATGLSPRLRSSKKARKVAIEASSLLQLTWILFISTKKQFMGIGDDLLNCYHLLLCCVDLVHRNLLEGDRTDLINPEFRLESEEEESILDLLCRRFEGVVLDAKHFRVHWWQPKIRRLVADGALGSISNGALLDNLEDNRKKLETMYEEAVLNRGEMDERILISAEAAQLLSDSLEDPLIGLRRGSDVGRSTDLLLRMSVQTCLEKVSHYRLPTPLSGRSYVIAGDQFCPATPLSTASHSVAKLTSLLADSPPALTAQLKAVFSQAKEDPGAVAKEVLRDLGDKFQDLCLGVERESNGGRFDEAFSEFAVQRRDQTERLFYRLLEKVVLAERERDPAFNFLTAVSRDVFHRSLYACALQIILFSYNSERMFPWVLDALGISAIHFYKVIELVIRAEPELSREMVKHLNMTEERVLEELAWVADSSLWDILENIPGGVPSCQSVSLPSQMDIDTGVPSLLAGDVNQMRRAQSPHVSFGRLQSPAKGTLAKRKLDFHDSEAAAKVQAQESLLGKKPIPVSVEGPVQVRAVRLPSRPEKPTGSSSLGLFFRKVYYLASVRLLDLADRLRLNEKAKQGVWTVLEHVLRTETALMRGRHLDQLLMCSLYVVAKASKLDISFHDIMCQYRYQPQAQSRVYRRVLMESESEEPGSGLRSGSTLPVPDTHSAPPTPEPKHEDYGDLIRFYNRAFVCRVEAFVKKLCPSGDSTSKENLSVPLSPLPCVKTHSLSPRRRVADGVFVCPMQTPGLPLSPARPLRYSFSRSPYKDLKAINTMIKQGGVSQGKVGLSSLNFRRGLQSNTAQRVSFLN